MAGWLGEVLGIDASNAYRRMRGEKELGFSELMILAQHIPSFSHLLPQVWATNPEAFGRIYDLSNWSQVQDYLRELVLALNFSRGAEEHFFYHAREIPAFLIYDQLELFRVILSEGQMATAKGKELIIPNPLVRDLSLLHRIYLATDSREIWYRHAFTNLIEKLRFMSETDRLSMSDLNRVVESLHTGLERYEMSCDSGVKSGGGKLRMHIAEFSNQGELMIFDHHDPQSHFGGFMDSGVSISRDPQLCELAQNQSLRQLGFSQEISRGNLRQRHQFFNFLRNQLDSLYRPAAQIKDVSP